MTEAYQGERYTTDDTGAGWLFFTGTVMGIGGLMRIADGIWALNYEGQAPGGLRNALLGDSVENYGWLWIAVGVLLLLSSFLVLVRSPLGRWVGIVGAVVTAVSAMAWMPYYPIWSMTYVFITMLVLYGLGRWGGKHPRA